MTPKRKYTKGTRFPQKTKNTNYSNSNTNTKHRNPELKQ